MAVFTFICAFMGRSPFGTMSILDMDLPGQYIHFYTYLKSVAAGENDLFYTFSKVLGGDMTGLSAYYLLSPFNLLFLLVPESAFPLVCTLIAAVKIGLSALFMAVFLADCGKRDKWLLLFSSAYALMAYNIVYFSNLMWMDAVYTLPIMALGLRRLFEGRSGLLYTLSLSYALIVNYYTGYMLCIFSLFFFALNFTLMLVKREGASFALILRYGLYSLLAGALSAAVLIPSFLSLSGTKATFDAGKLAMYRSFPLSAFALRLFSNSVISDLQLQNLPWLYTGLLSNVLLLLFFFNRGFTLRERLVTLAFGLALLLSFDVNGLYVIWHGFNYPACFPFRNAFILCFFMLYLAWRCFCRRDALSLWSYAGALVLGAGIVFLAKPFENPDLSGISLIADLLISLAIMLLLVLEKRPGTKRLAFAALALIQLVTLTGNGIYLKENYTAGSNLDTAEYASELESAQADILALKAHDDSFYRVSCADGNINEPMQLAFNSLSHFSSTDKANIKELMRGFGYRFCYDMWTSYGEGCTAAMDALFSVKYLRGEANKHKGYPVVSGLDSASAIAENPNALGIAFLADSGVLSVSLEGRDFFQRQEQAFTAVSGSEMDIFTPVTGLEMSSYNYAEPAPYKDGWIYQKEDESREAGFVYSFTAESADPVYICTYAPLLDYIEPKLCAQLYLNGEHLCEYMGTYSWETICLGSFEPGEQMELEIRPDAEFFVFGESFIYHEDRQSIAGTAGEIKGRSAGAELEKLSSSHLRWSGYVPENTVLMLTIPAERGWQARVDGQKADISTVFDTLMALELSAGEHTVELKYVPPGFYAGLIVSITAAAALLLWELLSAKRRRK